MRVPVRGTQGAGDMELRVRRLRQIRSEGAVEPDSALWRQTLEQQDAQQRLAANVFRQVALGELLAGCRRDASHLGQESQPSGHRLRGQGGIRVLAQLRQGQVQGADHAETVGVRCHVGDQRDLAGRLDRVANLGRYGLCRRVTVLG